MLTSVREKCEGLLKFANMATWRDVRRFALAMPGATESTARDTAAWVVNDKFFIWERPLRKSDLKALGERAPTGAILGVRTAGLEMKEVFLRSKPEAIFTTPHFDGYPAVLVQLGKIDTRTLKDLIVEAWLARAPKRAVTKFLQNNKKASR